MKCRWCGAPLITATGELWQFAPDSEPFEAGEQQELDFEIETCVRVGILHCLECEETYPWIQEPNPPITLNLRPESQDMRDVPGIPWKFSVRAYRSVTITRHRVMNLYLHPRIDPLTQKTRRRDRAVEVQTFGMGKTAKSVWEAMSVEEAQSALESLGIETQLLLDAATALGWDPLEQAAMPACGSDAGRRG